MLNSIQSLTIMKSKFPGSQIKMKELYIQALKK